MDNMTAKVSCFARAFHHKENNKRIFCDNVAEALLGAEYEQIAKSMSEGIGFFMPGFEGTQEEGLRLIVDRQLSPSVLARSAFCEDALKGAVKEGIDQYAIFASGYDTYAIRNMDNALIIYELDQPAMIEDKNRKIGLAGLKSSAISVPCNLANMGWPEELACRGFDSQRRSFGSLLGISYYLTKEQFKNLLKTIGKIFPTDSYICFDYQSTEKGKEAQINRKLAKGAGEDMKSRLSPEDLLEILNESRFKVCLVLDNSSMTKKYFEEYNMANPLHPMEAPHSIKYVLAKRK